MTQGSVIQGLFDLHNDVTSRGRRKTSKETTKNRTAKPSGMCGRLMNSRHSVQCRASGAISTLTIQLLERLLTSANKVVNVFFIELVPTLTGWILNVVCCPQGRIYKLSESESTRTLANASMYGRSCMCTQSEQTEVW